MRKTNSPILVWYIVKSVSRMVCNIDLYIYTYIEILQIFFEQSVCSWYNLYDRLCTSQEDP